MSPISITICFMIFAAVMFIWEKIPLAVTSMTVCLGLVVTGVLDSKTAFAGFINTNVILFVAMFIVGGALFETGMANKIGGIVTKFAKTEKQLIIAIMIIVGVLSGILSNTGTAAILIPVVVGIADKSGFARSKLLMPLVLAAAMGGNLTLIGAPGNLIAQSALEDLSLKFSFFDFAKIGLPMLACGVLYFSVFGHKLLPDIKNIEESCEKEDESKFDDVPAWKKNMSLVVLIGTIIGMVFEDKIGIPLHISGAIGALILVLVGVISEKQAYESIDMQTIFLFGGTLSLATALEETGAGATIAHGIIAALGENVSPMVLLAVLFLIACILTNIMSNTATTSLLVPIGISIATQLGADPRAVLMAIVIGGSCAYASPVGMPANTMVFSIGGYKFTDYIKSGLPLILVSGIVSIIFLPILFPFYGA
ncbi:MAG: SLC13 family permease [Terrisporobacter sp.]